MARKKRTSGEATFSLSKFSFWIVIAIGIAMAVSGVLNFFNFKWDWVSSVCGWVQSLCFALGMIVPIVLSYRTARNKGSGMFILWIILVVLVAFGVVSSILGLIRSAL